MKIDITQPLLEQLMIIIEEQGYQLEEQRLKILELNDKLNDHILMWKKYV